MQPIKLLIILSFAAVLAAPSPVAAETLSGILSVVRENNPTLKAARANWEAMKAQVPQARAWEDPMFGLNAERMATTNFADYTDLAWMLSQTIPVSGKNVSRGRAAIAAAGGAYQTLRRAEYDIISRTRVAYFKLSAAYSQLGINRRNETLLKQMTDITRSKYEVGGQSQADLLTAETELAKVTEQSADIERDIAEQESQLNVLMNRPAQTKLGQPSTLTFDELRLSAEKIRDLALAHRPEIGIAEKKSEAEKARLQLAHREWIPEPQLRIEARQFKDTPGNITEYDTGIAFSIPWVNFAKYSAGVREAKQNLEAAKQEYEAARMEALGMVRDQLKKIDTNAHHYELYRDKIVPLAQQAVHAALSDYESNSTGFVELITARRSAQEAESTTVDHLTNYRVAVAELEAIIGADPRSQTRSSK
jgi:outer membrane protein TolC